MGRTLDSRWKDYRLEHLRTWQLDSKCDVGFSIGGLKLGTDIILWLLYGDETGKGVE